MADGAFDAIERSYLREMTFIIYLDEHNPADVHEKYTFHFRPRPQMRHPA